jgi:hypothetical protein
LEDKGKFRLVLYAVFTLCVLSIAYNISTEYLLPDIEGFFQRKLYYEKVISGKGLSMHEADYWRNAGEPGMSVKEIPGDPGDDARLNNSSAPGR